MSENTTLPQRVSAGAPFGVVNWKFCVLPPWPCRYVQRSPLVLSTWVQVDLPVPSWMAIWSLTVEPITLTIHVANDAPLALLVSSIRSIVPEPTAPPFDQVAMPGHTAGF